MEFDAERRAFNIVQNPHNPRKYGTHINTRQTFDANFPLSVDGKKKQSSGENAMERISSGRWMIPSWERVDVCQKLIVRPAEYAINPLRFSRAMHELSLLVGTGHSEITDPEDASNSLMLFLQATNKWSPNQTRPVLYSGFTCTEMSTSKRPSLLSQISNSNGSINS